MTGAASLVGIDLGGTQLRAATAEIGDVTAPRRRTPAPAPQSLDGFVATVGDAVAEILGAGRAESLAVTVPGLVDGTRVRWVPNLPYLDGVDLADVLSPFAGTIVALNDAHAALLAEATAGAAAGADTALLLAIGTGIGSAVLAGGRVVRGAQGGACSFGWASGDADDPGDDRHGWLERHASGTALDRLARERGIAGDGAGLVAAARDGDSVAVGAIAEVGQILGAAMAGIVGLLDPSVVVISGGVADALDVLEPALRSSLDRQLPGHLRGIPVVAGRFGPDAGLVGALAAARRGATWWEAT